VADISLRFRKAASEAPLGIIVIMLASGLGTLSSCTPNFSTLVADHPGCAADAGITRWKIEQCLSYGNVHRDAFDMCLARQQVPPRKIEILDDCVAVQSGLQSG
jgi:hypothetical protein